MVCEFQFEELILKNNSANESYFTLTNSKTWLVSAGEVIKENAADELTSFGLQKKYGCRISSSKIEFDCKLFGINYDGTKKSSSFANTKYSQKEITKKSELSDGTLFKLKVNSEQLANIKLDGSETIELFMDFSNERNKAFAKLSPKFKLTPTYIYWETNLVFGKFKTAATTGKTTFKCQLPDKAEKETCQIYMFTLTTNNVGVANFSAISITTQTHFYTTSLYVLDLKTQKWMSSINTNKKKIFQ